MLLYIYKLIINTLLFLSQCPDGWDRFENSCYFRKKQLSTWDEARQYCQQQGADLVVINSFPEFQFIQQYARPIARTDLPPPYGVEGPHVISIRIIHQ